MDVTGLKKSKKGSKRILALGSYVLYLVKKLKQSGAKKASRTFPGAVKLKVGGMELYGVGDSYQQADDAVDCEGAPLAGLEDHHSVPRQPGEGKDR